MQLSRTVPAVVPQVLIDDARMHLRVSDDAEDVLIGGIVAAAVDLIGEKSGRRLALETWEMRIPMPSGAVALPKSPVIAVTGIGYLDASETLQAANLADFDVFPDQDITTLAPKTGKSWPSAASRKDAIRITFTAGYTDIPDALKAAIMLTVGHLFENREAVIVGTSAQELPLGIETLVAVHRLGWAAA